MKISSAKSKGRLLQQWVRDRILYHFPQLHPDDVRSTGMGQPGEDIQLSPKARDFFPFKVECKSRATMSVYNYYDQAEKDSGEYIPLVVIKSNKKKPLVVIDLNDFLELAKRGSFNGY